MQDDQQFPQASSLLVETSISMQYSLPTGEKSCSYRFQSQIVGRFLHFPRERTRTNLRKSEKWPGTGGPAERARGTWPAVDLLEVRKVRARDRHSCE